MTDKSICAGRYNEEQVLTASPEQLTLMLYNGAIDFISQASPLPVKKILQNLTRPI